MSWHIEFNASSREKALSVWDSKVLGLPDYTKKEAAPELAGIRATIERLITFPGSFYSIKTYGHHCKDDSKVDKPTHIMEIFLEIKNHSLE